MYRLHPLYKMQKNKPNHNFKIQPKNFIWGLKYHMHDKNIGLIHLLAIIDGLYIIVGRKVGAYHKYVTRGYVWYDSNRQQLYYGFEVGNE